MKYTEQERLASRVSKMVNGSVQWTRRMDGVLTVYNREHNCVFRIYKDATMTAVCATYDDKDRNELPPRDLAWAASVFRRLAR